MVRQPKTAVFLRKSSKPPRRQSDNNPTLTPPKNLRLRNPGEKSRFYLVLAKIWIKKSGQTEDFYRKTLEIIRTTSFGEDLD